MSKLMLVSETGRGFFMILKKGFVVIVQYICYLFHFKSYTRNTVYCNR
jgi:hypothetical protein